MGKPQPNTQGCSSEANHMGQPSKAHSRGEKHGEWISRGKWRLPSSPNCYPCPQASFLPAILQRATMITCLTYKYAHVTPLLKTFQWLLIPLRIKLNFTSLAPAFLPCLTLFHSFLCTYMLNLIKYLCNLPHTLSCFLLQHL